MADFISKDKRSKIMSSIKGKDTKVEIKLRKILHKKGYRFRVNYKIKGKPDMVFVSRKIAIFVDGDFWHGYNWKKLGKIPPSGFWQDKIKRNIKRDREVTKFLVREGWKVIRIWEHEINSNIDACINRIEKVFLNE